MKNKRIFLNWGEKPAYWHKLPPALRDHLEFIIPAVIEQIPFLGPPAAYFLHLSVKIGELEFDEDARKLAAIMGHMEFLVPWLFGLAAGIIFSHAALGVLTAYALHLTIKALTLAFCPAPPPRR